MGTRKTKTELDTLYADNTSGAISAADLRDFVETMKQPWGELCFGGVAGVPTVLASNGYTAATFPTSTVLNTSSLNVTKISGSENGLKYTGTPTVLAYVFSHFQFSTENDNLSVELALHKNASIATANTVFQLTPTLSGYAAATHATSAAYRQTTGGTITDITQASPMEVTTGAVHKLTSGDQVTISSVTVSGTFVVPTTAIVVVTATNKFQLVGSDGTAGGDYTSGGTWVEEDALGPRPRKGSHAGSVGQLISLATNDEIKLYVKNADWVTASTDDDIRIDNAVLGLFGVGVI